MNNGNGKSLAALAAEMKEELRDFIQTRVQMLTNELREKTSAWKTALPVIAIGLLFLLAAFLTLTAALVAAIAPMFDGQFAWAIALGIVTAAYLLLGGLIAWMGYREFTSAGITPTRTVRVLKQDQVWLQNEARSHS